jgi:hypothetical protein
MPIVNEIYKVYYVADSFTSGLTDVLLTIILPNDSLIGPFTLEESAVRSGVYVYNYTPTLDGQYYFEIDSVAVPKKVVQIIDFEDSGGGSPFASFD